MEASVLIIGAGMSGLSCAGELAKAGLHATVLEARDRLGGRIHTVNWQGACIDLGASWIHGVEGNPLTELVDRFNVATVASNADNHQVYHQGVKVEPKEVRAAILGYSNLKERLVKLGRSTTDDISVLAGVKKVMKKESGEGWLCHPVCETFMEMYTSGDYACSPGVLSLKGWQTDTDLPGGDAVLPGGYCELVGPLAKGLDVRLGHVVESVRWGSRGVKVLVAGRREFEADAAVVTVPLGVLQAGRIEFQPALPGWKNDAIGRLHAGSFEKVVLRFSRVFWEDHDSIVFTRRMASGLFNIICLDNSLNVPIMVGLLSGNLSESSASLSDEELTQMAMSKLREAFGSDIPEPIAVHRTRWGKDPFALGSFSSIPLGASVQDRENLRRDVAGKLFWAGEATSVEFCATVHGAYLSGIQTAQELIQKLRTL